MYSLRILPATAIMKTGQKPRVSDATKSKLKTIPSSKQPKNISTFFKQTKRNPSANTSRISISKTSNNLIKSETLILPPKDEEDLKWEPLLNMGKSELFLPHFPNWTNLQMETNRSS
ncbi:hypothetical protein MKX01_035145 [Papaver californicum]|nr:hypothetical protein MKX01_035145 [Papaver californicum]